MTTRLETLLALRNRVQSEIDAELAAMRRIERLRKDILTNLGRTQWNTRVLEGCCRHFAVDPDDVLAGRRQQAVLDARHVFMWLMRQQGRSYPEIGHELGMDHTTIINGVKRVENNTVLHDAAAAIHDQLTGEVAAA